MLLGFPAYKFMGSAPTEMNSRIPTHHTAMNHADLASPFTLVSAPSLGCMHADVHQELPICRDGGLEVLCAVAASRHDAAKPQGYR